MKKRKLGNNWKGLGGKRREGEGREGRWEGRGEGEGREFEKVNGREG